MSSDPQSAEQQLAIQKYLDTSRSIIKKVRDFDYKRFFQDILTFVSIIVAYFFISYSYRLSYLFKQILKVDLTDVNTLSHLFFAFSIYHISWNIIAHLMWKRALKLPPKTEEYEQLSTDQPPAEATLQQLPKGQKHYHQIVYQALNTSVYLFLLIVAVGAFSYFNQPLKKNIPKLVDIQKLNLIGVWFLAANLFYLIGGLLQKITKMGQFKVLGAAIGFIFGCLLMGLANGLNTFIFI